MKYYYECISVTLAEKLKEKGMPYIEIDCETYDSGTEYQRDEVWCNNTYAEVFDWLETKGIGIGISHHWSGIVYQGYDWRVCQFHKNITPHFDTAYGAWHEVAEKAIEKVLTLI